MASTSSIYRIGHHHRTSHFLLTQRVALVSGRVYNNGEWFNGSWLPSQQSLCIAYKELFPIVLACHVWSDNWARKRVECLWDNTVVASVITSGTSKDDQLMHLVRELYLVCTRHNFKVTAKHVPGKTNRLADALSRFQMQEFFFYTCPSSEANTQVGKASVTGSSNCSAVNISVV